MKKYKVSIALLFLFVFLFSSCHRTAQKPAQPETGEFVITDVLGRSIKLAKPAVKIIGTHNPSTDTAVVLGGGSKYLAGCGNKEMTKNLYNLIMDYDSIVQIGLGKSINLETVKTLGENLVAILPERSQDQIVLYESIGVPAVVALSNSESFDSVKNSLTIVGKVLGEDKRAQLINTFIDKQINIAKAVTQKATTKPSVIFLGSSSALSVAPDAMIQSQLIEIAGGKNAVSGVDHKGGFVNINLEQLIAWNPDIIWIPAYAKYTKEDLLNNPAWSSITAIKNKSIYVFPSKLEPWDYPTAAVCLGINWATYNLHPELFSVEDLKKNVDEFYQLVYGKTFTSEQLGIQ